MNYGEANSKTPVAPSTGFKVGDKVQVNYPPSPAWNGVGELTAIRSVGSRFQTFEVKFDRPTRSAGAFYHENLTLVSSPAPVPAGYKVGDKAKVIRQVPSFQDGWRNPWVDSMTKLIGKTGVVIRVTSAYKDIEVKFDDNQQFGFPEAALEKIEAPGATSVPTGPFVIEYDWSHPGTPSFHRSNNVYSKDRLKLLMSVEFSNLAEATAEAAIQQQKMGRDYVYRVRDLKTGNTYQSVTPSPAQTPQPVATTTTPAPVAPPVTVKTDVISPITTQSDALHLAKGLAVAKAKQDPKAQTNIDLVQYELASHGVSVALLGNAAGSVFKGKDWVNTGATVKSNRIGNRHRRVAVWQYVGA